MSNALDSSLEQAIDVASKPKLTMTIPSKSIKHIKVCEVTHDKTNPDEDAME